MTQRLQNNDSNSSGCAFHPRVLHVGGSSVSISCAPFSNPKASSTNYSSKTCSKPSANGELKYLPTPTFFINFPTNFILYIYKRKYVDHICGKGIYSIMMILLFNILQVAKEKFYNSRKKWIEVTNCTN
jgi:hypothetical protein